MKRNFVSYYGRKANSFSPLSTGLQGLDEESVHDPLQNVKDKKLSLMKLNETCQELKKLQALRKLFVKEVGSTSWEEAVAKFPHYTTDDQLKQFFNMLASAIFLFHNLFSCSSGGTVSQSPQVHQHYGG